LRASGGIQHEALLRQAQIGASSARRDAKDFRDEAEIWKRRYQLMKDNRNNLARETERVSDQKDRLQKEVNAVVTCRCA